jgi:predicted DNA-binding transcriptional regulator YafY
MRRADRLFRIIQILRRRRTPITANEIAEEMETSLRTIYRDISQLLADRVPIRGEAGIGYVLEDGFDMPPLMLTPEEVEAAILGAQWVTGRADPALSRAASDLIAKIGAVIPEHLRPLVVDPALTSPNWRPVQPDAIDMQRMRAAIHAQTKVYLRYRNEKEQETARVTWPIAVSYFETVRVIVAWCELRQNFRNFRTDRVLEAQFLGERYPTPRSRLLAAWKKQRKKEHEEMLARRIAGAMLPPPRDRRYSRERIEKTGRA